MSGKRGFVTRKEKEGVSRSSAIPSFVQKKKNRRALNTIGGKKRGN